MEDNEKPFACSIDDCNMSFTNEDHLTVHMKKHDMSLNLGNGQKLNMFPADQTPTPTRFIRNCEEVGLFQDLQINPFDETFRKAVESGKTGNQLHYVDSLHVSGVDDTLHTPHVFPFPNHNEDTQYKSSLAALDKKKISNDNILHSSLIDSSSNGTHTCIVTDSPNSPPVLHLPAGKDSRDLTSKSVEDSLNSAVEAKQETLRVAGQAMQLLLRMPDGKLVQLVQENNTKPAQVPAVNVTPIPTPENGLALAKMKLKQTLTNNGRIPSSSSDTPEIVEKPRSSLIPKRESSGEEEGDRKLKFRERNRAAAMRCREKRKTWVQELERRAEDMQATNQALQGEVTSLRAEVAQLKTLLLAHKNCPITQAMNQAQMINVSAMPMETIQTCLQPTSQPSRIVYQSTATTSTVVLNPQSLAKRKRANQMETPTQRHILPSEGRNESKLTHSVVVAPHTSSQYISFKHLLSACDNENNLNMEMNEVMLHRYEDDNDDDVIIPDITTQRGDHLLIEGSNESKVIKVNPNAIRFRNAEEIISRDRDIIMDMHITDNEDDDDDGQL